MMFTKKSVVIFLIALFFNTIQAQQTGDIVAYFGHEKIETVAEGSVIHHFTEGYALRNAFPGGVLFTGRDMLAWHLATENFVSPSKEPSLRFNYVGNDSQLFWQPVVADSAMRFNDDMRRAYLYTSYDVAEEMLVMLDATGHTRVFINGLPHEGDHYDYGYTLIPVRLKKGINDFIYTPGRFGRVTSKLILPKKPVMLSPRDMTLPAIISGENGEKWGAVRVVNASEKVLKGCTIECILQSDEKTVFDVDDIIEMTTRKLKFKVPSPEKQVTADTIAASLILKDHEGRVLDSAVITLKYQQPDRHHERTFVSNIDGSVQYYSVVPSLNAEPDQAFVLSVHGASVEATNQARAYKQKDWAHIVAPTNRRPFGFNWEEWGRIDAQEVMIDALNIFDTDPAQRYLTGHSMGGHGTWFLGATYPDKFAAIAPCAGYPDIIDYRRGNSDSIFFDNPHYKMIQRGASAGRVVALARNYLQSGVYVLHGGADRVVPVEQAQRMRSVLGGFHTNFAYYEYPDGAHWYGDHSMDWPPLFDFLRQNTIPELSEVNHIEFSTASPAVSSNNHWIAVNRQQKHYQLSHVNFKRTGDTLTGEVENVESITFFISELDFVDDPVVIINDHHFDAEKFSDLTLENTNGLWEQVPGIDLDAKYPGRYGGFKLAFDNRMIFVFATGGNDHENNWYKNKARFDAETFLYRGNGSLDIIPDTAFVNLDYADRNVILYGNAENNTAWTMLLHHAPVQVYNGLIRFGEQIITGNDLGAFFIYPRPDSDIASVGVISGTGAEGMRAAFANDYFSGITGFPDLMIFRADMLKDGLSAMQVSGFFGSQWDIENGDFIVVER